MDQMMSERLKKLALLKDEMGMQNTDPMAIQDAYSKLKDLKTEDSDFQEALRQKLLALSLKK